MNNVKIWPASKKSLASPVLDPSKLTTKNIKSTATKKYQRKKKGIFYERSTMKTLFLRYKL